MILNDATHEVFGYYAMDLRPYSRKSIIAACTLCGVFKVTTKENYHTFCKSCIQKGRKHTEEEKAKNSARMKCNTQHLGFKHTEKAKAKISAGNKDKIVSTETKALMSKNRADIRGKRNPRWNGGKKVSNARKRDLGYTLLAPLQPGEVGHHITNEYVMGIPVEVHEKLSGYSRRTHRTKVLQWLKANDKKKYKIVLCVLAKQPFILKTFLG